MQVLLVFKDILNFLLDLIYPRNIYCILCKAPIDKHEKYSLCEKCHKKINWVHSTCIKCGKMIDSSNNINVCYDCINSNHLFEKNISCVVYDQISKTLVHDLKFNNKTYMAYHMAEIMYDKLISEDILIDYIIPIPIHKNKLAQRGYNQCELICEYLSERSLIQLENNTLIKIKETLNQNELHRKDRLINLKNAFEVKENLNIKDKNILLVDDVFTTGSTINACCESLNKLKPKNIYSMTFSIGKNSK